MTDPVFELDSTEAAALAEAGMRAMFEWLETPSALQPADELPSLRTHLAALRETHATAHQRADALDQLYTRSIATTARLLPTLADVALPVPRKTRLMVRSLQDLLRMLAEDMLQTLDSFDEHLIRGLRRPKELTLHRTLHALVQHLLISDLVAAPAGVGIWQQLHQVYATARRLGLAESKPEGELYSLQQIYFSALLLGCAQPASFTSREISFIADYVKRFADYAAPLTETAQTSTSAFWIDPARDAPPFATSRKAAAPDTNVFYFTCDRLAELLGTQLTSLETGSTAEQTGLPAFAGTTAGHGALRRLTNYWGHPSKRRFPRRRQNYRAELCAGLDNLWRLLRDDTTAAPDMSTWMITNESPDGYTIMHVSGKTGKLAVGDISAIRTESGKNWQICLVRWGLSENPEHLELGLQILAPRALPATLTLPVNGQGAANDVHVPVLILPEIPLLRPTQTLIAAAGMLHDQHRKLALIVEQDNVEVREVRATRLDEQTGCVELFSIQDDARPY